MYTRSISVLALLSALSLVSGQDNTLTVPFATVTYPTGAPASASAAVSAAQSAFSSARSALQSDFSSVRSVVQSDASSVRSAVGSDISAAASAASGIRSQVNSYQSSLLANPTVKSLIDQVTEVLPSQRYTNLGALETFAVNAPDGFIAAYGPAISTASFYSSLRGQESSINSELDVLRTAVSSGTQPTTLSASTIAATTVAATTVSGSVIPATTVAGTTVAATTVAGVTAAATGAAAPLATKAAMGVIGLAAGVIGIAMM